MDLRIVTERFKVSDPLYRLFDGFLVYNISGAKFHFYAKALQNHLFQDLNLHFSHNLGMDLSQLFVPEDLKFGNLLLQLP